MPSGGGRIPGCDGNAALTGDRTGVPLTLPEAQRISAGDPCLSARLAGLADGTDPFAAAVRTTRMAMIVTNPREADNPIVYVNDAFCQLSGYSREEALGRNCRFLQGCETDQASVDRIRDAVAAGTTIEIDIRNHFRNGDWFWNRLLIAPIRDTDGTLEYFFASHADVTAEYENNVRRERELAELRAQLLQESEERQKVEEAFRQVRKMEAIGQLTGGIAHDFNNMLQAIGGSLELIDRRIAKGRPNEAVRFIDSARRTVERASALTDRLLAFARRQSLQPRPVSPDSLIEEMADLFRQTMDKGVALELDLQADGWMVQCDPSQLENALLNLVINARDAMPGGGRLLISTRCVRLADAEIFGQEGAVAGDYVEVSVADTGIGMDDMTRDLAFDPFFTTKPLGQGTGLGLSQLYGFVRQSNGIIGIESALGEGTTVQVSLPRHHSAGAGGDAPAGSGTARGGQHDVVLLVEDEDVVRAGAAEQLRDLGYQVMEAKDGVAALQLLQAPSPVDLLVTDVGLPGGLNGRQVADQARENRPTLPVLFITGFAGSVLKEQLAPGMEVIGKPFTLDALASRVQRLVPRLAASPPG